jgi:hypothetical protein
MLGLKTRQGGFLEVENPGVGLQYNGSSNKDNGSSGRYNGSSLNKIMAVAYPGCCLFIMKEMRKR